MSRSHMFPRAINNTMPISTQSTNPGASIGVVGTTPLRSMSRTSATPSPAGTQRGHSSARPPTPGRSPTPLGVAVVGHGSGASYGSGGHGQASTSFGVPNGGYGGGPVVVTYPSSNLPGVSHTPAMSGKQQEYVENLLEQIQLLQSTCDRVKSHNDELEETNRMLTDGRLTKDDFSHGHRDRILALEEQVHNLREELSKKDTIANAHIESIHDKHRAELNSKDSEMESRLESQRTRYEKAIHDTRIQLTDSRERLCTDRILLEKEVDALRMQLSTAENHKQSYARQVSELSADLVAAKQASGVLDVQLKVSQEQARRFEDLHKEASETVKEMRQEFHDLRVRSSAPSAIEVSMLRQDNQDLLAENRRLEVRFEQVRSEKAHLENRKDEIEEELNQLRLVVAELRQKETNWERTRKSMETEREDLNNARQELQQERETLHFTTDTLRTEVTKWQRQLESTTAALEAERRKTVELQVELQNITHDSMRLKEEFDTQRSHFKAVDASNTSLRSQLQIVKEDSVLYKNEGQEAKRKCDEMEAKLAETAVVVEKLGQQLALSAGIRDLANSKSEWATILAANMKLSESINTLMGAIPICEMAQNMIVPFLGINRPHRKEVDRTIDCERMEEMTRNST